MMLSRLTCVLLVRAAVTHTDVQVLQLLLLSCNHHRTTPQLQLQPHCTHLQSHNLTILQSDSCTNLQSDNLDVGRPLVL